MARIVPPVIRNDYPSQGEKEIFRRLRDDPGAQNWVILHSLALARHERRVAGEIDFVVIVPHKGIICLEVKGCSTGNLRRENGLWYYGPNDKGDARGPFRQAYEAMHTLRRRLLEKHPELSSVLFASRVAFPYAIFTESSVEWNDWEIVDCAALRSAPISHLLSILLSSARKHLLRTYSGLPIDRGSPTLEQSDLICDELRGNFEIPSDPKARGTNLASELRQYTAEQFEALDSMSLNPRTLFVGPAGTGKTLLALEAARRARAEGRRILLVCFNHLLGGWLDAQASDLRPHVVAGTLHRQMLMAAGLPQAPEAADSTFWERDLPRLASERLATIRSQDGAEDVFDELVVDEAQDLLHESYLDFLDLSLRGGLGAGQWRIFGDFENQAIHGSAPIPIEEFRVKRANGAPLFSLRVNCRNTPLVAEWVHLLGGLTPPYRRVLRPDDGVKPHLRFYHDAKEQRQLLASSLTELRNAGFDSEDVVVLSTRSIGACAMDLMNISPWRERLRPVSEISARYVRYGTIHSFKGLESPVVVVTDLETVGSGPARALLYVAITRTLQKLVVLANERVKGEAMATLSKMTDTSRQ